MDTFSSLVESNALGAHSEDFDAFFVYGAADDFKVVENSDIVGIHWWGFDTVDDGSCESGDHDEF